MIYLDAYARGVQSKNSKDQRANTATMDRPKRARGIQTKRASEAPKRRGVAASSQPPAQGAPVAARERLARKAKLRWAENYRLRAAA